MSVTMDCVAVLVRPRKEVHVGGGGGYCCGWFENFDVRQHLDEVLVSDYIKPQLWWIV